MEAAGIEPVTRRKQNPKQVALLPANALISHQIVPPLRPVSSRLIPFHSPLEGHTGGTWEVPWPEVGRSRRTGAAVNVATGVVFAISVFLRIRTKREEPLPSLPARLHMLRHQPRSGPRAALTKAQRRSPDGRRSEVA
jgi:hypothetical protein